jgi:glucokinase
VLDDDANCAALGEKWLGAGKQAKDFIYIIIGTGIGGGLILNGALYRGAAGGAGEIGHGTLLPDGPLCSCGNHGCLEALAAGPAIARRANQLMPGESLTAQMVIERARAGEVTARQVIDEAGYYLGIGLANVVNLLNPEVIAIGGGVALDAGELLLAPARTEMRRRAFASSANAVRVELAQLGDDAGLIGAARLVWDHLQADNHSGGNDGRAISAL